MCLLFFWFLSLYLVRRTSAVVVCSAATEECKQNFTPTSIFLLNGFACSLRHTYIYIYIYVYICSSICMYIYIYTVIAHQAHKCIYVHAHIHSLFHVNVFVYLHVIRRFIVQILTVIYQQIRSHIGVRSFTCVVFAVVVVGALPSSFKGVLAFIISVMLLLASVCVVYSSQCSLSMLSSSLSFNIFFVFICVG